MMFEATEVTLDPGVYRAKLKTIEEAERSNFDTGEPESCRDWMFEVVEEGFEGTSLKGRTSMSFAPRSKAREWVEGLLARKISTGEKLGLEELLGKECDLSIVHKDTDRGTFANISSVNPVRKKSRQAERTESDRIAKSKETEALSSTFSRAQAQNDAESDELPDFGDDPAPAF
jgi:hypothetical protein